MFNLGSTMTGTCILYYEATEFARLDYGYTRVWTTRNA